VIYELLQKKRKKRKRRKKLRNLLHSGEEWWKAGEGLRPSINA
jgi:hypothetical protein